MAVGKTLQKLFGLLRNDKFGSPFVARYAPPFNERQSDQSIRQPRRTMGTEHQSVGEFTDRETILGLDSQDRLMLLGGKSDVFGCFLAEVGEAAKRLTKVSQCAIVDFIRFCFSHRESVATTRSRSIHIAKPRPVQYCYVAYEIDRGHICTSHHGMFLPREIGRRPDRTVSDTR
jgi:hypothetical protein